jgi:hypothetical protein
VNHLLNTKQDLNFDDDAQRTGMKFCDLARPLGCHGDQEGSNRQQNRGGEAEDLAVFPRHTELPGLASSDLSDPGLSHG